LGELPIEKIAGFFAFLVKSGLGMSESELTKICYAFKESAMRDSSKDLLSSTAIFSKVAAKMVVAARGQEKDKEILRTVFKSTIEPIIEQHMEHLSIAEASMALRSIQAVSGFSSVTLPNRVMSVQLRNLPSANHLELAALLDVALDVNLSAKSKGTGLLDQEPCDIIREICKLSLSNSNSVSDQSQVKNSGG
jgi:hypothetical protein